MKTYIYPENLRAAVKLWFWSVRDFIIICTGIIISVMLFAKLWTPLPAASTVCYAFLTLRTGDAAILDYMINALRFFCTAQQEYRWQIGEYNVKKEKKEKPSKSYRI